MRCSSLHLSLVLGLGLMPACSSASREAEPDAASEPQPATAPEAPSPATPTTPTTDEPQAPTVGAPAPGLALASLSGTRVQLPVANAERATVLVFGSFS